MPCVVLCVSGGAYTSFDVAACQAVTAAEKLDLVRNFPFRIRDSELPATQRVFRYRSLQVRRRSLPAAADLGACS